MTGDNATRVTTSVLTFGSPFRLAGDDELFPAGSYEVQTTEAVHHGIEHTAYLRISTVLIVKSAGGRRYCEVNPKHLDAAADLDAGTRPDPSSYLAALKR